MTDSRGTTFAIFLLWHRATLAARHPWPGTVLPHTSPLAQGGTVLCAALGPVPIKGQGPRRNRFLLRPIAHHRHYGRAVWIDPVVLRAITISWNNIIIPGSWPYHGHPDDKPHPWFTNDFGLPRMGCGIKRPQVTQHQGRSESERHGHYPHASASLPQTLSEVRYRDAIRGTGDIGHAVIYDAAFYEYTP
jgi:hypothetical protein